MFLNRFFVTAWSSQESHTPLTFVFSSFDRKGLTLPLCLLFCHQADIVGMLYMKDLVGLGYERNTPLSDIMTCFDGASRVSYVHVGAQLEDVFGIFQVLVLGVASNSAPLCVLFAVVLLLFFLVLLVAFFLQHRKPTCTYWWWWRTRLDSKAPPSESSLARTSLRRSSR
jgi:hypothetical protein